MHIAVFAVFMLCTPNFLICEYQPAWTRDFDWNTDLCKEYVHVVENTENTNTQIVMGHCVWRMIKD